MMPLFPLTDILLLFIIFHFLSYTFSFGRFISPYLCLFAFLLFLFIFYFGSQKALFSPSIWLGWGLAHRELSVYGITVNGLENKNEDDAVKFTRTNYPPFFFPAS
jgi:hypothetical protein